MIVKRSFSYLFVILVLLLSVVCSVQADNSCPDTNYIDDHNANLYNAEDDSYKDCHIPCSEPDTNLTGSADIGQACKCKDGNAGTRMRYEAKNCKLHSSVCIKRVDARSVECICHRYPNTQSCRGDLYSKKSK